MIGTQLHRLFALACVLCLTSAVRADDWPQWLGPQRDSIWRETGILDKFPKDGPKVKWRAPIGTGYTGPAVADGRVFVMDYVTKGDTKGTPIGRGKLDGNERVLCFNAADGKELWKHEYACPYNISYPAGPRCTPTVSGGKVYALGAMGDLTCLEAVSGKVVWSHDLKKEYKTTAPLWGFAGHPLVYGNKLICLVGGKDSVAVAFDKDTGKELWRSLTAKEPGYCPPTMIEAGGKKQLLIWHAESINGLDPETGKPYWSVPLEPSYGMSIMAPRKQGDYLFACGIQAAAATLKLASDKAAAEVVWRGEKNTGMYCVNSTPFVEDGMIYGIDGRGELRGVKLATGERVWESLKAATDGKVTNSATAFLVKNGDRFFIANEKGELIIAKLSPKGYEEIDRCKLIAPTGTAWGREIVWSHPAFANKCVYARNDKELICVSLAAEK